MSKPIDGYCEYLDRDMTIMGLLSAFGAGAAGFSLERLAGANATKPTWQFYGRLTAFC